MTQIDKAGTSYWDENWSKVKFPKPFNHTDLSLDNYVNLELHKYFQKVLGNKKGFSVLEIGCANSTWPIYFHQYFDAKVYGLDYSEIGCEKSRSLLEHYKIPGEVYCADLFSPPPELLGKFDLVVSFGVVEHFENTADCLKSCAALVKPGGLLLTLIPNMPSMIGLIQKFVDREIYDIHMPITKKKFINAHKEAGLPLKECDYFLSISLSVVNYGSFSKNPLNKYLRHALSASSKIFWILERYGLKIPKNQITSPYLIALCELS